jgi:ankyrin repeat protein
LEINSVNEYGYTPLHVAVDSNNPDAVRWFIKFNADLDATLVTGETPLQLAQKRGYEEIVRALENAAVLISSKKQPEAASLLGKPPEVRSKDGLPPSAPIDRLAEAPLIEPPPPRAKTPPPPEPDAELVAENQSLRFKVQHLEQALIEKNALLQAYRTQFGQLKADDSKAPKANGADRSCFRVF